MCVGLALNGRVWHKKKTVQACKDLYRSNINILLFTKAFATP